MEDLEILPPQSARAYLNSRGFLKVEKVVQNTESNNKGHWLTTAGHPGEELYLGRLTAAFLGELATALKYQQDSDAQIYEVTIRAVSNDNSDHVVAFTPSQTPEIIDSGSDSDSNDSIDSDTPLVTVSRRKLKRRKRQRASKAAPTCQTQQPVLYPQITTSQAPTPQRPIRFFSWSHEQDQKARKEIRTARIAALVWSAKQQSKQPPAQHDHFSSSDSDVLSESSGSSEDSSDPLIINKVKRELKKLSNHHARLERDLVAQERDFAAARANEFGGDLEYAELCMTVTGLRRVKLKIREQEEFLKHLRGT
ncbi:hypothetical protein QBC40DRAFT_36526 [Triangularia verruculosa]|uniref:Uncharacterized protein n=1 Tax=Triangularia verruculosa TaxID=2587418 RepID=A0AAN6XS35_9PEZI|nr:hypothetical protein QBC40DRAFT_36526 [Triangularia verruculosa]